MVSKIDHLGVLVEDIDENRELFELLDVPVGRVERVPAFGVDIAFIRVGESLVELVEPVDRETALADDLDAAQQSALLHHVAFRVDDIEATLATLRRAGVALADQRPRRGAGDAAVAFLDQRAGNGVRVELVERETDVQLRD
ncbi:VOC family protein [Halovenus sp. WSH3]|uniref:VOC family protein n=1 Tax=Halovenus carboxidivorans TaxID=2692199 RepID=A0A6B0SXI0_9EURY|nr:VOC family protein [Halovenus carboxidivorans]MXR50234.1 VOC family protein [Halovenus carboxidivorans]